MLIRITTERTIAPDEYADWIWTLKQAGVPINGKTLRATRRWAYVTDRPGEHAKTVYEIVGAADD